MPSAPHCCPITHHAAAGGLSRGEAAHHSSRRRRVQLTTHYNPPSSLCSVPPLHKGGLVPQYRLPCVKGAGQTVRFGLRDCSSSTYLPFRHAALPRGCVFALRTALLPHHSSRRRRRLITRRSRSPLITPPQGATYHSLQSPLFALLSPPFTQGGLGSAIQAPLCKGSWPNRQVWSEGLFKQHVSTLPSRCSAEGLRFCPPHHIAAPSLTTPPQAAHRIAAGNS